MSTCKRFQATSIPTCTEGAVFVDGQMTDLAGGTGGAPKDLLVNNKACPDSTAYFDKHNILFPSACTKHPFAQGAQIRIVIQSHGPIPQIFQSLADRKTIPARHDGRCHDHADLSHDGSGHPDTDGR